MAPPYFPEWGTPDADRLVQAAAKFPGREWWGRLWVIQEVLLARELEFCFGRWKFDEPDVWLGMAGFVMLLGGRGTDWRFREREGISRSLMMIGRLSGMRNTVVGEGREEEEGVQAGGERNRVCCGWPWGRGGERECG